MQDLPSVGGSAQQSSLPADGKALPIPIGASLEDFACER
jgi:hypothetical protein